MAFLHHFLLVFDHSAQRLVSQEQFSDGATAAAAYAALEAQHRDAKNLEIVLVGADSLDTIMQTHGHYFREAPDFENPFPTLALAV
jgi:hypothetical protein